MTLQQLVRELRGVPPREVDEWIELRAAQINALPKPDGDVLESAVAKLKNWLRETSPLIL